jgi:hypothetical protein
LKRILTMPIILFSMITGMLTVAEGAAQAATTDVGVVPASRSCPIGVEAIVIRMDDEDDNNQNSRSGNIGAIRSDSNTEFFFCRVNGASLRAFQPPGSAVRPYAVLKLGANCPNGSQQFSRRFDNEDDSNNNFFQGNIFPSTSDSNTNLVFCLFAPGLSTMTTFPNFGFSYLTFSSVDSSGFLRTDDEDDSNNNQYSVPTGVASIAKAIVSDGSNTTIRLRVAR